MSRSKVATPIVVVGTEKSFAELALVSFGAKIPEQDTREVADAVREANPHANLDALTPGTVLNVPACPMFKRGGAFLLDDAIRTSIEALVEAHIRTLDQLVAAADAQEVEQREER